MIKEKPEKMIFYNAKIHTCNKEDPAAEAMEITNGKITAVGDNNTILQGKNSEKTIDLKGKTILPGFFDAHAHYWKIGDLLTFNLDLRDARSIADIQELLTDFSKKNPHLKWIRARGFNETMMKENRLPTKEDIDQVVSDKPVFLQRTCAHIATLNTKALEICEITKDTKPPFGGEIQRGDNGLPNGVLTETALGLAIKHFPQITDEDYEIMILAAGKEFLKNGVTSVSDPAVMPDLLEVYKKMDREGTLPVRIHAFPIVIPDGGSEVLPIPERYESDKLVVNTVKFFADGGLSGQTAATSRIYKNSKSKGVLRLEKEKFFKLALEAQKKGFQIATHAIGDRAIDLVLEVYQELYKANPEAPKHRIEHLGLATDEQMDRIKEMGLHIVTQPVFLEELGKNFRMSLDDEYLNHCYRFKTMLDKGISVSFSTDAPVVKNLNPFIGIKAAIDRKDKEGFTIAPDQGISAEQSLYCYTMGSAVVSRVDHLVGSLQTGKKADFIVLDRSPFEVEPEQLPDLKPESVWINGEKV
jgi:predicted amidohydrolase YtcJ